MLKLSNITKRYTLGGSTIDALRGVDLGRETCGPSPRASTPPSTAGAAGSRILSRGASRRRRGRLPGSFLRLRRTVHPSNHHAL